MLRRVEPNIDLTWIEISGKCVRILDVSRALT